MRAAGVEPDGPIRMEMLKAVDRYTTLGTPAEAIHEHTSPTFDSEETAQPTAHVTLLETMTAVMEATPPTGMKGDEFMWRNHLQAHLDRSDVLGARAVMKEMCSLGVKPNKTAWSALLKAYANLSDAVGARAVMVEMCAAGVRPNAFTWNTLLKAHADTSDLVGARAVMEEMRAMGVKPDEATLSALLKLSAESKLAGVFGGQAPTFDSDKSAKRTTHAATYKGELSGGWKTARRRPPAAEFAEKPAAVRCAIPLHTSANMQHRTRL
jgi:pentatricopeptide repeat protein